jgi:electron transfer flavoprotein beta subunit
MLRVVVPIKQVAALDDDFELEDGAVSVDPEYLELDLNEWDNFSLEAALQIKDAADGEVEVVALTMGDEDAEEALLSCLAKGADRAIRVWDDALDDAEPLLVASVLAPAIERERPDLVLCGVQSSDAGSGATGIALAGRLELPHVAVVRALEFNPAERVVVVDRELEGGLVEQLSLPTPALLTIQTGANEPRYATLRAIKQAASKPLDRLSLGDLGLDQQAVASARGARTVALAPPAEEGTGATMLDGDVAAVADRILAIVDEAVGDTDGGSA